ARTHPRVVVGSRHSVAAAAPLGRGALAAASAPPSVGGLLGVAARRGPRCVSRLLAWSRRSAADVLGDYFSPGFLGPMLTAGPVVWGISPLWPGTGLGAVAPVLKHLVPAGRPVGGSGALTDALRAAVEAAGGTIRTGAAVERIGCEHDRLRSVRTRSGDELLATAVVVACDPRRAFVEWLEGAPPSAGAFLGRWTSAEVEDGYESKIDALVTALPRYRGLDDASYDELDIEVLGPTMTIGPDPTEIDAAYQASTRGRVGDRPVMLANLPTVLDPSMAPDGHHVFSLEVLYTPYALDGGWAGSAEPERWLERYAGLLEPGFLDHIVDWRVMTPERYETEFHMPRGHATSFAGGPVAALTGRSERERSRYRTPVDGLYLTGAATFPGAGVWGAPGRNAAHVVLKDFDRPARAERIRIRTLAAAAPAVTPRRGS
ncbi:MAG: NAD(P)/FAD-dependent oxidoreductase, partial [Actinomycetota bacterium]